MSYQNDAAALAVPASDSALLNQLENFARECEQFEERIQRGEKLDASEACRIFTRRGQMLVFQGRASAVDKLIEQGLELLPKSEGYLPEHTLYLLEVAASNHACNGKPLDAIEALDKVFEGWKALGNEYAMAATRFSMMEFYLRSNQPKMGWVVYTSNADLFESTGHTSTTLFVSTLLDIAKSMGNDHAITLLEPWLALVEDQEWESCPQRQARNKVHFEEHYQNQGGLSGLLGVCHSMG